MNLGVYIHIPFCRRKCLYCDFPSSAGGEALFEDYSTALCREIAGRGGLLSAHRVDSLYFGGGTPTLLPLAQLESVVACLQKHSSIEPGAEFTLEANPGTLDGSKLTALHALGVNRLSIGVQAFDDQVLVRAGRIHTAAEAIFAVEQAADCGFTNISIDLMYGLPGQSLASFRAGLEQAVALPVSHISVYGLKVEEGTPFHHALMAGNLDLPDEDEEAAMYELAADFLPQRGYRRYEISNYAKAGAECRHNLKYWRYQPYLGLGAAAHSFLGGERRANIADAADYIAQLDHDCQAVECRETPDPDVAIAEYAFLALRTAEGLQYKDFTAQFGVDFSVMFAETVKRLASQGLLECTEAGVRLTIAGMRYGNIVFASFLPDP
ncbi:MAG: radical SAM family heme chaperone HemW [Negativicutes bacterium]|nr:radical SAM family heme chaperone HemW [Negativicutes bacterium]